MDEIGDGAGGGERDDDVVGQPAEARHDPLQEQRADRGAEEEQHQLSGRLAEAEASQTDHILADLDELVLLQLPRRLVVLLHGPNEIEPGEPCR